MTKSTRKPGWEMRLPDEDRANMARLYQSGQSSVTVGEMFGCNHKTVLKAVSEHGGTSRPPKEAHVCYPINHHAFDQWTDESAYWAGFLTADGCIRDCTRSIHLSISETDGSHVYAFRDFLGTSHPVYHAKRPVGYATTKRLVTLSVTSERLVEKLRAGGLRQFNGTVACAELATNPAYWRGVIDGDGSIAKDGSAWVSLVGGKDLLNQFLAFVKSLHGQNISEVRRHKSIWQVRFSGESALVALRAMYMKEGPSLQRKRMRALARIDETEQRKESRKSLAKSRVGCISPECDGEYYAKRLCRVCYFHQRSRDRTALKHQSNGTIPLAERPPQAWFRTAKDHWYYYPNGKGSTPRSLGVKGIENRAAAKVILAKLLGYVGTR